MLKFSRYSFLSLSLIICAIAYLLLSRSEPVQETSPAETVTLKKREKESRRSNVSSRSVHLDRLKAPPLRDKEAISQSEIGNLIEQYGSSQQQRELLHQLKGQFIRLRAVQSQYSLADFNKALENADSNYEFELPAYGGGFYPVKLMLTSFAKRIGDPLPGNITNKPGTSVLVKSGTDSSMAIVHGDLMGAGYAYFQDKDSDLIFISETKNSLREAILGRCDCGKLGVHNH